MEKIAKRGVEGAAFSSGTSRRSFPTLPVDFKHSSNTSHTVFVHLLSFYCSREKTFNLFFSFRLKGHDRKKEGIVFLLIQHAIIPDIKINRATSHMQIPACPCMEHRLGKQQPCVTDLEQCRRRHVR